MPWCYLKNNIDIKDNINDNYNNNQPIRKDNNNNNNINNHNIRPNMFINRQTDVWKNRRTDGRTNRSSYRNAKTYLKGIKNDFRLVTFTLCLLHHDLDFSLESHPRQSPSITIIMTLAASITIIMILSASPSSALQSLHFPHDCRPLECRAGKVIFAVWWWIWWTVIKDWEGWSRER